MAVPPIRWIILMAVNWDQQKKMDKDVDENKKLYEVLAGD
jgi:hypothetical protein